MLDPMSECFSFGRFLGQLFDRGEWGPYQVEHIEEHVYKHLVESGPRNGVPATAPPPDDGVLGSIMRDWHPHLSLRLYHNDGDGASLRPLVFHVHGGGWTFGDMGLSWTSFPYFTARGYAVVSVQYSLTHYGYDVSDMVEDIVHAFAFVREHAAEWRIDPRNVVFAGDSAGGQLSTLTAYRLTKQQACGADGIIGVLNLWGATELALAAELDKTGLWAEAVEPVVGVAFAAEPETWRNASASSHLSALTPPTLTFHGKWDTLAPFAGSELLHSRLEEEGVRNLLVGIEMTGHIPDKGYSSLGGQMKRYVMERFLAAVSAPPNTRPVNPCADVGSRP